MRRQSKHISAENQPTGGVLRSEVRLLETTYSRILLFCFTQSAHLCLLTGQFDPFTVSY